MKIIVKNTKEKQYNQKGVMATFLSGGISWARLAVEGLFKKLIKLHPNAATFSLFS